MHMVEAHTGMTAMAIFGTLLQFNSLLNSVIVLFP